MKAFSPVLFMKPGFTKPGFTKPGFKKPGRDAYF
jgi:hypothetical protein